MYSIKSSCNIYKEKSINSKWYTPRKPLPHPTDHLLHNTLKTLNHLFQLRWSRNKFHWHIFAISPRQTPGSQYQCLGWHPPYIWNVAIANRAYRTRPNGGESHLIPRGGIGEQTNQIYWYPPSWDWKHYRQRPERKDMLVVFIRQQYVISEGSGIIYIMINHAPRKLIRKGLYKGSDNQRTVDRRYYAKDRKTSRPFLIIN